MCEPKKSKCTRKLVVWTAKIYIWQVWSINKRHIDQIWCLSYCLQFTFWISTRVHICSTNKNIRGRCDVIPTLHVNLLTTSLPNNKTPPSHNVDERWFWIAADDFCGPWGTAKLLLFICIAQPRYSQASLYLRGLIWRLVCYLLRKSE